LIRKKPKPRKTVKKREKRKKENTSLIRGGAQKWRNSHRKTGGGERIPWVEPIDLIRWMKGRQGRLRLWRNAAKALSA